MTEKVILVCTECLSRNYTVDKKKGSTVRIEEKKYCRRCNRHTLHRETK